LLEYSYMYFKSWDLHKNAYSKQTYIEGFSKLTLKHWILLFCSYMNSKFHVLEKAAQRHMDIYKAIINLAYTSLQHFFGSTYTLLF